MSQRYPDRGRRNHSHNIPTDRPENGILPAGIRILMEKQNQRPSPGRLRLKRNCTAAGLTLAGHPFMVRQFDHPTPISGLRA